MSLDQPNNKSDIPTTEQAIERSADGKNVSPEFAESLRYRWPKFLEGARAMGHEVIGVDNTFDQQPTHEPQQLPPKHQ